MRSRLTCRYYIVCCWGCWLQSRAALPCSDEAFGRPRAMMYRWLRGWLAGVRGGVQVAATGAVAGCRDERWCARSTRLRGRAVGSSTLMSPLLMRVVSYSFLNELSFAGQMASFIQVTACQPVLPLAGWQSWWAWLPECSSACQGPISLFVEETEKVGVRELFVLVVKLLLTRSVCCFVYGQRKESCNVGVSTVSILQQIYWRGL